MNRSHQAPPDPVASPVEESPGPAPGTTVLTESPPASEEARSRPELFLGYENSKKALESLRDWYTTWNGRLADRSVEVSYALIGANWAVFGSRDQLLDEPMAKISLVLVVTFLGLNLALTRIGTQMLQRRYYYAESNSSRWDEEYQEALGTRTPWPSTRAIDGVGQLLREIRTWMPLAAGVFFLIAFSW
jgi:hypothetical protein